MWPKELCFTGKQMGTFHWFQQERAIPLCPCKGIYTDQLDRFCRLLVLQFSLRRPENSIFLCFDGIYFIFVINELHKRVTYAHTHWAVFPFSQKKYSKMIQKIYWAMKTPLHRPSKGNACSLRLPISVGPSREHMKRSTDSLTTDWKSLIVKFLLSASNISSTSLALREINEYGWHC